MQKLTFSGHESFACKQFWLKKVFDFAMADRRFSDDHAVVELGVGKNMVASLRYWGKAIGVLSDDDIPTDLATYLFTEDGKDPYLEDIGTIWLLHYHVIKARKASLYNLFYNEFRRERIEFTKDHLHSFVKRKCDEQTAYVYNANTVNTDINVFLRNYVKPSKDEKTEIEEDFSCIFLDLEIIREFINYVDGKLINTYKIEAGRRTNLPAEVLLYAILDNYPDQTTIPLHELQLGFNSPGSVFALSYAGLFDKIEEITQLYPQIIYSETAGNQILQFRSGINKQEILDDYYR